MNKNPFESIASIVLGETSKEEQRKNMATLVEQYPYFHSLAFVANNVENTQDVQFDIEMINPMWGMLYKKFLYPTQKKSLPIPTKPFAKHTERADDLPTTEPISDATIAKRVSTKDAFHNAAKPKASFIEKETKDSQEHAAASEIAVEQTTSASIVDTPPHKPTRTKRTSKTTVKKSTKKITTSSVRLSAGKKIDSNLFKGKLYTFTEWLSQTGLAANKHQPKLDTKRAEKSAKASAKPSEMLTESMAEVWLQQNEPKRAIGVYKKLNLLFTDKSAYFADRIDDIKRQYHL